MKLHCWRDRIKDQMNFFLVLNSFVNSRNIFRLRLSYDWEQQVTIKWLNDFESFVTGFCAGVKNISLKIVNLRWKLMCIKQVIIKYRALNLSNFMPLDFFVYCIPITFMVKDFHSQTLLIHLKLYKNLIFHIHVYRCKEMHFNKNQYSE